MAQSKKASGVSKTSKTSKTSKKSKAAKSNNMSSGSKSSKQRWLVTDIKHNLETPRMRFHVRVVISEVIVALTIAIIAGIMLYQVFGLTILTVGLTSLMVGIALGGAIEAMLMVWIVIHAPTK